MTMNKYSKYNRAEIAANLEKLIADAEAMKERRSWRKGYAIRGVCDELSIFDWWNDRLSISQMKQMRNFLKTAEKLGYNGYVCFKVGAKYCSHGMWAYKEESTTGMSPDGEFLFHSFRSDENYWDCKAPDGRMMWQKYDGRCEFTLKEVKAELGL